MDLLIVTDEGKLRVESAISKMHTYRFGSAKTLLNLLPWRNKFALYDEWVSTFFVNNWERKRNFSEEKECKY